MADTSYRSRIIFKKHTGSLDATDFTGTYNLLLKAKSIPSPVSPPNTVESTTLEDDTQTFEMGIKTADAQEITGNLEKEYLDAIDDLGNDKIDIFYLLGTDGVGGTAKYCRVCQATATPSDIGGVDEILEMTVTIVPNTTALKVTDQFTVTDNGDGTFEVTKASVGA